MPRTSILQFLERHGETLAAGSVHPDRMNQLFRLYGNLQTRNIKVDNDFIAGIGFKFDEFTDSQLVYMTENLANRGLP